MAAPVINTPRSSPSRPRLVRSSQAPPEPASAASDTERSADSALAATVIRSFGSARTTPSDVATLLRPADLAR